jgi:DNA polymerase II small subunit
MFVSEDELKKAVKILLKAGFRLSPSTLPLLRSTSNPIEIAQSILDKYSANTTGFIKDEHIRSLTFSQTKKESSNMSKISITSNVQSIDERINNSSLVNDNTVNLTPKINSFRNSVINTSVDDLDALHNFEKDIQVHWEPNFSNSYLGDVTDMLRYFSNRFEKLSKIFRNRSDIGNITKISRLNKRKENDKVSVIGMVIDKQFPPTGGGIIELDDPTSDKVLSAIIPKKEESLVEIALKIMNDTVICVSGILKSESSILVNNIHLPDIPLNHTVTKADIPVHVAFLSDIHVGSNGFLSEPFEKFVQFLHGNFGNRKMQKLGKLTKYVLFAGDVVDGVGVYPNQEDELEIVDVREQYNVFANYIERFPDDVEVVIIPGNHDHVRSAEPQPVIPAIYAKELHSLKNVHMLANPSQIKIHGVKTLLYHCTSLPDILNFVPGLKTEKPVEVMIKMLQARHLAPIWNARTPLATEPEDSLVIENIPDLFHGGHIHINDLGIYNNVRILNSGTMQDQTSYQKALNITPTPGEVIVMNLKTLTPNLLRLM